MLQFFSPAYHHNPFPRTFLDFHRRRGPGSWLVRTHACDIHINAPYAFFVKISNCHPLDTPLPSLAHRRGHQRDAPGLA